MNKMRKLTRADWMTWSGVEQSDYFPPLIGEVEFEIAGCSLTVILERGGLSIYEFTLDDETGEPQRMFLMPLAKMSYTHCYLLAQGLLNAHYHEYLMTVIDFERII